MVYIAINREPKAILAYRGPIAPSMIKIKVDANKPMAKKMGRSNRSSMENAAMAKQTKVIISARILPQKLSSVSARAAAIMPKIRGTMPVFWS